MTQLVISRLRPDGQEWVLWLQQLYNTVPSRGMTLSHLVCHIVISIKGLRTKDHLGIIIKVI